METITTIYCDMDGVLTDFDRHFMYYTNNLYTADEYKNKFGVDGFWGLIDDIGLEFWTEMPWMQDGRELWRHINKLGVEVKLLSSPSASDISKEGKKIWAKENMPNTELILKRSAEKREYAKPCCILIDDRASNCRDWREDGGIAIQHFDAKRTIAELNKVI